MHIWQIKVKQVGLVKLYLGSYMIAETFSKEVGGIGQIYNGIGGIGETFYGIGG